MKMRVTDQTLHLAHSFTLSRGSSVVKCNPLVVLEHQGLTGYGEAAPNTRYDETPESTHAALAQLAKNLPPHPDAWASWLPTMDSAFPGAYAAKAALDTALLDLAAKRLGVPLYRLWGLDPTAMPVTSFTIAIDSPEQVRQRAQEAADTACLKVKLGGPDDRQMIAAIREVAKQPIRVDVNEGWTDRQTALSEIQWLADQGVELIEQPMPASAREDMIWLKQRSPLPLFADEALTNPQSLPGLAAAYHGVNIKLQKCGGIHSAKNLIAAARIMGLDIMLGCMIASSVAIAAAAHLAPLADVVDLDGHLLITDDPFEGLGFADGRLVLPEGLGLGVRPKTHP